MNDPLPADVRDYLERTVGEGYRNEGARQLLAKYPRSQPELAWEPGDVVLWSKRACLLDEGETWSDSAGAFPGGVAETADLIARGGRRVHPPRFADHARLLHAIAELDFKPEQQRYMQLHAIAADLAGDNDD